jgi:anti-sigma factor RsiW
MNAMTCNEASELLPIYGDGELDLQRAVALEKHMETCASCKAALATQRALSGAVRKATYHRVPDHLRERLRQQLPVVAEPSPLRVQRRRRSWTPWAGALAASLALAIGINVFWSAQQAQTHLEDELISGHVRSLMVGHLQDVVSSDHHTVKPWFTGKLDFSPPVTDLSAQEFPLTGGRLDYIDQRNVAALAYRHGAHTINLFIWPAASDKKTAPSLEARRGYNLAHWADGTMNYWAVSDLNADELRNFAQLLQRPG